MKQFVARTIGIVSPSHPQDARPSSMNPLPHEDHGEAVEQTRGTSAHRATITDAIITSSQRHERIPYQGRQNYFPNTARSHSCQRVIICTSTLKNMTPNKQRRVLTLLQAKLADATTRPEEPAFLSSPCHAWILPEDDFQRVPKQRTPTQEQQRVGSR